MEFEFTDQISGETRKAVVMFTEIQRKNGTMVTTAVVVAEAPAKQHRQNGLARVVWGYHGEHERSVWTGHAYQHPEDKFDSEFGRTLALKKALRIGNDLGIKCLNDIFIRRDIYRGYRIQLAINEDRLSGIAFAMAMTAPDTGSGKTIEELPEGETLKIEGKWDHAVFMPGKERQKKTPKDEEHDRGTKNFTLRDFLKE